MRYDMVMPIRKLPQLLINQIAAGEVIERPASVVKELVENSLDAGATQVDVAIEDGGRDLIRISDNGVGIPHDELSLAVASHATSKLESAEQLERITTLGFRGEALASIASISRLRLTSRATVDGRSAEEGWLIEAEGDRVSEARPVGTSPGTVIEVRDLFFNTPARRKFLRTAPTEFGHISEIITRVAMVWPHVGFSLRHGDRTTLELPPHDEQRQRCVEVLGDELNEMLLDIEDERGGVRLWGLAGKPALSRSSAKYQYVFVNGRPVKDRNLGHAIREAYRGLIPPDRHAVVVAMLTMDPEAVDVNVHPTKAEVRFREPSLMHGLMLTGLRQRLLGTDLTPSAAAQQASARFETTSGAPPSSDNEFVDYFRRMDPKQKGFVFEQVREAMAEDDPDALLNVESSSSPASTPAQSVRREGVLQVHHSYLVTQDEDGILIVDQHALHERVMFETLKGRIGQGNLESQRLLMPTTIRADEGRLRSLEKLGPLLERIGIEAEPIGPKSIAIHAFASFLFDRNVEPGEFVEELLDREEAEGLTDSSDTADEAALHEVLDMMACKAAVKAGDQLSSEELDELIKQRDEVERSSNCPHGRPTTIRMTLGELAKQFKRT